jgi:GMP synthase (glutamine-hydrolysing)
VLAGEKREYGDATLKIETHTGKENYIDRLFQNIGDDISVWMLHGDKLSRLPENFRPIASTVNAPFAGIASISRSYFGIQFHPEVTHTREGSKILSNFAVGV